MNNEPASTKEAPVSAPKSNKKAKSNKMASSLSTGMLVTLGASLIVGFFGGFIGSRVSHNNTNTNASNAQAKQVVASESQLISTIAKDLNPSVVSINVTSQAPQADYFGNIRNTQEQSAGTGFIISDKGDILTNRHVVPSGATTVSVTLSDGTTLDNVDVIGRTSDSDPLDVAFLRIKDSKGKKLTPVKLGDSSKVQVGDMVVAIGNALGQFQNTVTSGIISGFGRSVQAGGGNGETPENLNDLFQTDAAINQGNSGGPLVNSNSEVIGINTAVAGDGATNIGFAIPINDVQGLIKSVLEKGKLERPYLGVRYVSLTDDYAAQQNLSTKRGAYLAPGNGDQAPVLPNSPAATAGLQSGDIITKVDNKDINETNNLTSVLGQYSSGDKVTLTVIRDGKTITIPVTLGVAPQS